MAFKKALFFETVQGGIDRAFGQVKVTATPLSQGFDHGIPVRRAVRENCQQEKIQVSF